MKTLVTFLSFIATLAIIIYTRNSLQFPMWLVILIVMFMTGIWTYIVEWIPVKYSSRHEYLVIALVAGAATIYLSLTAPKWIGWGYWYHFVLVVGVPAFLSIWMFYAFFKTED